MVVSNRCKNTSFLLCFTTEVKAQKAWVLFSDGISFYRIHGHEWDDFLATKHPVCLEILCRRTQFGVSVYQYGPPVLSMITFLDLY